MARAKKRWLKRAQKRHAQTGMGAKPLIMGTPQRRYGKSMKAAKKSLRKSVVQAKKQAAHNRGAEQIGKAVRRAESRLRQARAYQRGANRSTQRGYWD